jgi:hypothetical protein
MLLHPIPAHSQSQPQKKMTAGSHVPIRADIPFIDLNSLGMSSFNSFQSPY